LLQEIYDKVREKFSSLEGSHDWFHIERVLQNARLIQEKEGGDLLIIELGALLHDIADHKFHDNDFEIGSKVAKRWVMEFFNNEELACKIEEIVSAVSYKGANVKDISLSLEGKIVRDADRLDAIGAVGIARAFAYGGSKHRPLFNERTRPVLHNSKESYAASKSHTINHFYEKLLLLVDRMETNTARSIGKERQVFMLNFLEQFFKEVNFSIEDSAFDLTSFHDQL